MRRLTFIAVRVLMCLMLAVLLGIAILPSRKSLTVIAQQEGAVIPPNIVMPAPGTVYRQTNFLSDIPGLAPIQDPFLVNPWGISATASSPFWVANNGTSRTQLIRGDVGGSPLVLNPSPQTITIPGGLPTGTVANTAGGTEFVLPGPCASPPCRAAFLFAS